MHVKKYFCVMSLLNHRRKVSTSHLNRFYFPIEREGVFNMLSDIYYGFFFPKHLWRSLIFAKNLNHRWDKVFKSGLSKFFKGCLPQNLLSPLLNTLSQNLTEQHCVKSV